MKKLTLHLLLLISFHCNGQIHRLEFKNSTQTINLNQLIKSVASKVNEYFNSEIRFILAEGSSYADKSKKTVYIGLADILLFSRSIDDGQLPLLVSIIASHEIGHILQDEIGQTSSANNFLYETQADIYAGSYLFYEIISSDDILKTQLAEKFNTSASEISDNLNRLDKDLNFILDVYFYLGENYDNEFHPNGSQRKKAIKSGFNFSMVDCFYYIPIAGFAKQKIKKSISQTSESFLNNIDYITNETYNSWSLRQAKKIIHYDPDISNYIIFSPVESNINNGYLHFEMRVKNVASFPINLLFSFEGDYKGEFGSKNISFTSIHSLTKNIKKNILAESSLTIVDSIEFGYNNVFYPSIIQPTHPEFKYAYEIPNQSKNTLNIEPHIPLKSNNIIERLPVIIYNVSENTSSNCSNLRASPLFVNDIEHSDTGNFLCYYSDWHIIADLSNNDLSRLYFGIYEGSDIKTAASIFENCKKKMIPNDSLNIIQYISIEEVNTDREVRIRYEPMNLLPEIRPHSWILIYQKPYSDNSSCSVVLLYIPKRK